MQKLTLTNTQESISKRSQKANNLLLRFRIHQTITCPAKRGGGSTLFWEKIPGLGRPNQVQSLPGCDTVAGPAPDSRDGTTSPKST